eukprot:COSAG04_NODE_1642_length_6070_cov_9.329928_6_plen_173_part_00
MSAAVPEPERRKRPDLSVPARRKWAAGIFAFVAIPLGISWGAFGFSQRKAQTPGWQHAKTWRRSSLGQDEQRPDIVTRPRNAIPTTRSSTPATLSGQPRAFSRWPALQRAVADAISPHQRVSGRAQKPRPRAWMRRFQMGREIQTRAALKSTGRAFTHASTLPSHRRDTLPT